jgi:integrase
MPSPKLERTATPGIFKRGGRYVVVRRDLSGRQRKLFARTLAEARRLKGKPPEELSTQRYRFGPYAQGWIGSFKGLTRRGIGQTTREDYVALLGLTTAGELLEPERGAVGYFGRMWLDQITTPDLRRYADTLFTRGLTRSSVLKELAPVRALLATAHNDGLIRHNPARGLIVQAPVDEDASVDESGEEERVKALTEDELARLLEQLPFDWPAFFRFLAETGLRIGEAIELRYGDVDGTWLNVDRRYYRGRVGLPKGRKKRRVPISTALARELWTRRKEKHASDDELVWTSATGKRIVPSNLMSRVLKPAAVAAGLGQWVKTKEDRSRAESWVGLHTFRHTTATRLFVGQAWNAVQVCRFLGHSDPGFTLRTYVHLLPENLPEPDFGAGVGNTWATRASEMSRNGATAGGAESRDLQKEGSAGLAAAGT